ncbi:hypothetical protein J6590_092896 [Homalodisca vitripennis]|nr:hypothetical protein J6590_092896 [Homalodisca vitripennis]
MSDQLGSSEIDRELMGDEVSDLSDNDCSSNTSNFTPPMSDSGGPDTDEDSDIGETANNTHTNQGESSFLQDLLGDWDNNYSEHSNDNCVSLSKESNTSTILSNTNNLFESENGYENLLTSSDLEIQDDNLFTEIPLFEDNQTLHDQLPNNLQTSNVPEHEINNLNLAESHDIHMNDADRESDIQQPTNEECHINTDPPAIRLRGRGERRGRGRGQGRGRSLNCQPAIRGRRNNRANVPIDNSWSAFQGLQQLFDVTRLREYFNLPRNSKPIDYYKRVITDDIVQLMVDETNRNAVQTLAGRRLSRSSRLRKWQPIDLKDMKNFLGLLI